MVMLKSGDLVEDDPSSVLVLHFCHLLGMLPLNQQELQEEASKVLQ